MSLTEEIKEYALDLGFCRVGITDSGNLDFYQQILEERNDPWINSRIFKSDPKAEFPECKSVIALAYDYANVSFPEELTKLIGRAYLARCYTPRVDSICGARLELFEKFLKSKGLNVMPAPQNLPIRQFARKAGIASFGKNNFIYVDGVGSFVILYAFLVDQELEYDAPERMSKCPPNCRLCIDACPTRAIVEPFRLATTRCVGYSNWMRRGRSGSKFDPIVPHEIRPQLGIRIHGCDACQEACPRNQRKLNTAFPKDQFLELLKEKLNLTDILLMDDDYYKRWIYPIMYNYLPDKRYFQRNAAIAMGNTGNKDYIPALEQAMSSPDDLIRLHSAWALGRIGGADAKEILIKFQNSEQSENVKAEISQALEAI